MNSPVFFVASSQPASLPPDEWQGRSASSLASLVCQVDQPGVVVQNPAGRSFRFGGQPFPSPKKGEEGTETSSYVGKRKIID